MSTHKAADYHQDAALFREALTYTESTTGFSARLVEKDYFCSVLLQDLFASDVPLLVFKGGTCLSKVHAEFYRLSEDLDFAVSVTGSAGRLRRRQLAAAAKRRLAGVDHRIPIFRIIDALQGHNRSLQYIARLGYRSVITGHEETIKIELSLREPILTPIEDLPARTLLIDPFRRLPAVPPFPVTCLSCREAYAEKLRAALSRRDPAIRDFFDLERGVRLGQFSPDDPDLTAMVRSKLAVPGNNPIDVSEDKRQVLRRQVAHQLAPVLRVQDVVAFDIDRAFDVVSRMAVRLLAPPSQ